MVAKWQRLIIVAGFALAGCAAVSSLNPLNWWGDSGAGPKPAPLAEIISTFTLNPAWRASVGGAGAYLFVPALGVDTVYAASADGTLAAFDTGTGAQRWRVQASRTGLSAGVGADKTTVVVATIKGEVLAFDPSGKEKWKAQVTSEVLAPPLVTEGSVLVRSNDNRIFSFDAANGKRLWTYQRSAPALVLRNFGGLVAGRGLIYAGFPGGKLATLSIGNGSLRWEGTVAQPKGATELERIADISSAAALGEREVCAVAFQGRAACFDALTGQPAWSRELSSHAGMVVDSRYAFVADDRSAIVALVAGTGSSLWKQDKLLHRGLSAPLSLGRAVIVGDYQGFLHAISREDGSFIGRAQTDGGWIAAPPQALQVRGGEGFLVQTRSGGIFAFSI